MMEGNCTLDWFAEQVALVLTGDDRDNIEEMHVRSIDVIEAINEVFEKNAENVDGSPDICAQLLVQAMDW